MLERLILGDTLNFATTVDGYPASSGWVLKYRLVPRTAGAAISITCIADGELHRAQVAATTTAGWTAGTYSWASWVELGTEKYSVATGSITLVADPRTASAPFDLRTEAEVALDQARAAFAAWTPTTKKYTIGGRSMEFNSTADIIPIVQFWEREVAKEQRANDLAKGLADRRRTYVRMSRG
jgi:hypothetical protein